jgi:hypothetical protein
MLPRAAKQSQLINSNIERLTGTNNLEVLGSFKRISFLSGYLSNASFSYAGLKSFSGQSCLT